MQSLQNFHWYPLRPRFPRLLTSFFLEGSKNNRNQNKPTISVCGQNKRL